MVGKASVENSEWGRRIRNKGKRKKKRDISLNKFKYLNNVTYIFIV